MRLAILLSFYSLAWVGLVAQVDIVLDRDQIPDIALHDIAKSDSVYVAVGQTGLVLSSNDGINWEPSNVIRIHDFIYNHLRAVTWNGTVFLAAGDLGRVYVSEDGVQWMTGFTPSYKPIHAVTWNGTHFISAGELIGVSTDGLNWTEYTAPELLKDVACIGNTCVTVGEAGSLLTTTDLSLWVPQPQLTSADFVAVDTLGFQFIAIAVDGSIYTSGNGTTWALQAMLADEPEALSIANNRAIVLQKNGKLHTSINGSTWLPGQSGLPDGTESFLWDGERFVGVGTNSQMIYGQSVETWWATLRDETIPNLGAAKQGDLFIAANQAIWTSGCARSWRSQAPPNESKINSISKLEDGFIAVGENGTVLTSPDGYHWEQIPFITNENLYSVAVGPSSIIARGTKVYRRSIASNNWEEIVISNLGVSRVISDGERFMTLGGLASKYHSVDGVNWEHLSGGGAIIDNQNGLVGDEAHAVYYTFWESFNFVGFAVYSHGISSPTETLPPYVWRWRWMDDHFLGVGYNAFHVDEQANSTELTHPWGIRLERPIVSHGRAYIASGDSNFRYVFDETACECPIFREPENTTACIGKPAQLTVHATNATSYQWRKEGAPIPGATEATFTIAAFALADEGFYDCVVQTPCITVTSAKVFLENGPGVEVSQTEPPLSGQGDPQLSATFSCDPGGLSWYWRDIANNFVFGVNQNPVRVPPSAIDRDVEIVVASPGHLGTARKSFKVALLDAMWIDPNEDQCQDVGDLIFVLPFWNHEFPAQNDPNRDGTFDVRDFLYIPINGACD